MQTKDHRLLGSFLLRQQDIFLDPMRKSLFLLGCVEPDLNPVTYTRGSLHHRFLHGHNAENAGKHLARLTQKLHKSGVQSPLQWFRFGAALHYLADSFTFAHNSIFSGNLKQHRSYEHRLHRVFTRYLQACTPNRTGTVFPAETRELHRFHRRYLYEVPSCQTDCCYITEACLSLCRSLRIQAVPPAPIMPKRTQSAWG